MRLLLPILSMLFLAAAWAGEPTAPKLQPEPRAGLSQDRSAWDLSKHTEQGCPLGLDVNFATSQSLLTVAPKNRSEAGKSAQRVRVNLENPTGIDVVAVDAHVRGITGPPRELPTDGPGLRPRNSDFAIAPFHTDRRLPAHSEISLDWALNNATAVEWVQLDRIAYADGFTWRRRQAEICKVAPDLLVRVN